MIHDEWKGSELEIICKHISKQFPGVKALDDVSFTIKEGEVHALVGENGAGKSTLLNILHGVYSEYDGTISLFGDEVHFKNTNEAIRSGIAKVHQEISLVTSLSVGQNILLGYEPKKGPFINYSKLHTIAQELLDSLDCNLKSESMLHGLSAGEMQMISIAKALFHKARLLSLDEPTASLSNREVEVLFKLIRNLKKSGMTILYVSHRLDEIFEIADRVTILRDGCFIGTYETKEINREILIKKMVGRDVSAFAQRLRPRVATEQVVLDVRNLSKRGVFEDVNFSLYKGEILGFSGLVGAKRTDVMRCLFGADIPTTGEIFINGTPRRITSPNIAMKYGIGLIPENRKTEGVIKNIPNADNVGVACMDDFLTWGFVDHRMKRRNCETYIEKMKLYPPDPEYITSQLSGGNQQKVIIARWLSTRAEILILDEPTKGIDVGAKAEIYQLLEELVHEGKSVIIVSSELPEIIGLCDRVVVMHEGKKTAEVDHDSMNEEILLHYAMGGK
jgi:ribose transport system ATP-binding protein